MPLCSIRPSLLATLAFVAACTSAESKAADTAQPDSAGSVAQAETPAPDPVTQSPASTPEDSTSLRPARAVFTISTPQHTQAWNAGGSYDIKGTAGTCGFVQDGMFNNTAGWSFDLIGPVNAGSGDNGEVNVSVTKIAVGQTTSDFQLMVDVGRPGGKLNLAPAAKASEDVGTLTLIENRNGKSRFKVEGTTYDKVKVSVEVTCDPHPRQ